MMTAADIVDRLLENDEDVDPKGFVMARDQEGDYDPILIHGSYGTLHVNPYDGTVMDYLDAPEGDAAYSDIVRFDLDELRRWIIRHGSPEWRHAQIVEPGASLDIVDVSFWTNDGTYVPGEEEHRQMSWAERTP